MNSGMIKTTIREIKGSLGRYLAIVAIVMLGVALFTGLKATTPAMIETENDYLTEQDFYDFRLLSTVGFEEDDVRGLEEMEQTASAEGAVSVDAVCTVGDGNESVYKFHTIPERINRIILTAGRLPERADECVLDSALYGEDMIGAQVTVTEHNGEDTLDMFENRTFTAVGIVRSPYYINFERGTTSIGEGKITAFLYVMREAFACEELTEIYVKTKQKFDVYTDAYETYIDGMQAEMEEKTDQLALARYERITGEARDEIQEAQEELDEKMADAKRELADAWKKIRDGEQEIADGEQELREGKRKAADGEQELAANEKKLADGERELADGGRMIQEKEQEIRDAQAQLQQAEQEIASNEKKLADGTAQIAKAKRQLQKEEAKLRQEEAKLKKQEAALPGQEKQLRQQKTELAGKETGLEKQEAQLRQQETELTEKDAELAKQEEQLEQQKTELAEQEAGLKQQKADLEKQQQQLDAEDELSAGRQQVQTGLAKVRAGLIQVQEAQQQAEAGLAQVRAGRQQVQAGLQQVRDGKKQVQAGLAQVRDGKKQVEAGKQQLESGKQQLQAGKQQLESGKQQLQAGKQQLAEKEQTLNAGKQELAAGKVETEKARSKLEAGRRELENAKAELARSKTELADGRQQLEEARTELADAKAELRQGRKDLDRGKEELADARKEYADAKAEFEQETTDAQKKIDDARSELEELEEPDTYVLTRNTNIGYACYESDSNIVAGIANVFPVFFFLVAALICMTTMNRMVEEQRTQIGVLKALGYGNGAIMWKYLFYAGSAAAVGAVSGCVIGTYLFPKVIWIGYRIMYSMGDITYYFDGWIAFWSILAALVCSMGAAYASCRYELYSVPASLIRPKAPKSGKRIFLEHIGFVWNRMKFLHKVSIRNIFRYKKRFFMMVLGISGCTALLLTGFGIKDSVTNVADMQYDEIQIYDIGITFSKGIQKKHLDELNEKTKGMLAQTAGKYEESVDLDFNGKTKSIYLEIPQDANEIRDFFKLHTTDGAHIPYPSLNEVVLSEKAAEMMGIRAGDSVVLRDSQMRSLTVTVIRPFE